MGEITAYCIINSSWWDDAFKGTQTQAPFFLWDLNGQIGNPKSKSTVFFLTLEESTLSSIFFPHRE